MEFTQKEVLAALQHVVHPASGKDIVSMGLLSALQVNGLEASFTLTFAKAQDPMKTSIVEACHKALRYYVHPDMTADIRVLPSEEPAQKATEPVIHAKHIIAVASGKGGVGKSTVAVNLAVALAQMGHSVCLLDADLYGPSIPKMLGVEDIAPTVHREGDEERITPVERYGVRMLSIGFFVRPEDAVIWRGPMASNALRQLLRQGDWGNPEYMLIDLPPGTGDVHLTIVQELQLTGAVVVGTPQEVALLDVLKGINLFRNEKINVPVLGLVENMAWFSPAESPTNRYYLFGREGCKRLAERENIRLLGQIPIVQGICESGDAGEPVVAHKGSIPAQAFAELADNVVAAVKSLT